MNFTSFRIRIIEVPPGEAPLWVREKWVGLELPLAQQSPTPISPYTVGVLSRPSNLLATLFALLSGRIKRASGFKVKVTEAMQILESVSPEAA